jgi:hypothetical protein
LTEDCDRSSRGKGTRGRGKTSVAKDSEKEDEATNSQNTRGGRSVGRGRGFGRGKYVITCYRCGVEGHKASKCLERQNATRRTEARTQVTQADETTVVGGNVEVLQQEKGENLMFRRVLLKPETKVAEEPEQRKKVFKTKCKIQDKCCHLVIDGGSTKNLVSTEVMEKLKLKIIPHPNPYKVSWLKRGQQ